MKNYYAKWRFYSTSPGNRNGEIVDITDDEGDTKTRERLAKAGYYFITEQEAKNLRKQI